jgi:biotin-(acetyl-CoA carboxylase) ligase
VDFDRYVEDLERLRPPRERARASLVVLSRTPSTNQLARGIALDYEQEGIDLTPVLLLAYEQTSGRGRMGRSWSSPRGRGVYATLVYPVASAELLQSLPLLAGTALCEALTPHLPVPCRLKWPNDLVVEAAVATSAAPVPSAAVAISAAPAAAATPANSMAPVPSAAPVSSAAQVPSAASVPSAAVATPATPASPTTPAAAAPAGGAPPWAKLGGVLIEALVRSGEPSVALIGFGVNHGHRAEDLPPGATSLGLLGAGGVPLAQLTWDLVAGLESELARLGDIGYAVERYRRSAIHRPGDPIACRVGEEVVEGTFLGFDDRGQLRLRRRGGEEMRVAAGEVISEVMSE